MFRYDMSGYKKVWFFGSYVSVNRRILSNGVDLLVK